MVAESEDGLLFFTVQVYSPPVVTVRVCVYCAVSGSSNTLSVPSVTVVESLVQVTVVAGPPVEIQVRVSWSESNTTSPATLIFPVWIEKRFDLYYSTVRVDRCPYFTLTKQHSSIYAEIMTTLSGYKEKFQFPLFV